MKIQILRRRTEAEEGFDIIDEFDVAGVDPLRVLPVHEKIGIPLTAQELTELIIQIQPLEPLNSEEPESFYAQNILAQQDGKLSSNPIDIPHHIGLRVAIKSILQKYKASDLLFQIS